jgi:hypothetical protein
MWRCRTTIVLAAFVAAVLAACGGASSTATPSAAPSAVSESPTSTPAAVPTVSTEASTASGPTTRGTLPAALAGTFAARVDRAVVAASDEAGDWFLVLTPGDGYQFGRVSTGEAENSGDLVVVDNRVTFSNEQGPGACTPDGSYTWSVDGSRLTLTRVTDRCTVRVNQYVHQAYSRCPGEPTTCAAVLP